MALTVTRPYVITSIGGTKSRVALSGTVYAGDPIGFTTGWVQAAAIATAPIPAEFVALEDGVSGDVIEVAQQVVISGGISAATLGYPVFLSVTPGEYAQAANGSVRQQIGWVSKADEINIDIGKYGHLHVQRIAADNAALYVRDYMALAAASAYALRAYETVLGVAAASAYGIHSTLAFAAGGDVTGTGVAGRFTLDSVTNQALLGTMACLMLDSNIARSVGSLRSISHVSRSGS